MAEYVLKIRQGDTFQFEATYLSAGTPVNLTGWTAEMVITWPEYRSARERIAEGEILCDMGALGTDGVITATLTAEETATIPVSGPVYDGPPVSCQLRITSGATVETLMASLVFVSPNLFDQVA